MTAIEVTEQDDGTYHVTVTEDGSTSTHEVTVRPEDQNRLARDYSVPDLVEASFRFLLEREPKESIMARFDLGVIERFFPEYEERIGSYL